MDGIELDDLHHQLATALRLGRRLKTVSRHGEALSVEQLPRARDVPACYLMRIGGSRIVRRDVFLEPEQAAARLMQLVPPERLQVALEAVTAAATTEPTVSALSALSA